MKDRYWSLVFQLSVFRVEMDWNNVIRKDGMPSSLIICLLPENLVGSHAYAFYPVHNAPSIYCCSPILPSTKLTISYKIYSITVMLCVSPNKVKHPNWSKPTSTIHVHVQHRISYSLRNIISADIIYIWIYLQPECWYLKLYVILWLMIQAFCVGCHILHCRCCGCRWHSSVSNVVRALAIEHSLLARSDTQNGHPIYPSVTLSSITRGRSTRQPKHLMKMISTLCVYIYRTPPNPITTPKATSTTTHNKWKIQFKITHHPYIFLFTN